MNHPVYCGIINRVIIFEKEDSIFDYPGSYGDLHLNRRLHAL